MIAFRSGTNGLNEELERHRGNKSDISCLKNQPDAFPVQYTQLSLGQANKLQL